MTDLKSIRSTIKSIFALLFTSTLLIACGGGGGGGGTSGGGGGGGTPTPDVFTVSTIDSSATEVGLFTSIALGSVHISYHDVTNGTLKYAYNNGSSWSTEAVDSSAYVGEYSSISIDGTDNVHISYYDVDNDALKYATGTAGSFSYVTVDTSGIMGEYTAIAAETSGSVHISYYEYVDPGNDRLMYATCDSADDCVTDNSNWSTEPIDASADNVGQYTSLALNGSDVHISYYDSIDASNGHLKYATGTAGSFDDVDVDTTGDVGQNSSIAVESDGTAHIAYFDASVSLDGDLKYATCSGAVDCITDNSNWTTETIDSIGDVGDYPSIAVETDGTVHISYYDYSGKLKYASGTAGSFTIETVDSSADVGLYTSISVESDGTVHISYYDWDNQTLKYAVR